MTTASELLGLPVPSDEPVFLLALGGHLAGGVTAVFAGGVAALAPKRAGVHPRAGLVYLLSICWVFVSSSVMAVVRWPHDVHLLAVGTAAFLSALVGYTARLSRHRGWRVSHLLAMGASYVLLLTGFYVDNGPNLPLWRHLPPWSFWFLPTAVAAPLIIRSWRRHATPRAVT